jgi:hypothetical protein
MTVTIPGPGIVAGAVTVAEIYGVRKELILKE